MTSIVVVARGDQTDTAALRWAAEQTRPGDDLHIVHPYRELALRGSSWGPAVRAADAHRSTARRTAAHAVTVARQWLRDPFQAVGSSAVAEPRHELLGDLARIADLIVIGVPAVMPTQSALIEGRRVALRGGGDETSGLVALVPESWHHNTGMVVLADPAGSVSRQALDYAIASAAQLGTSVRAIRPYRDIDEAAPGDAGTIATERIESEQLDLQLADAHRPGDPGLVGEVVREPLTTALRRLRGHIALLVEDCPSGPGSYDAQTDIPSDCALVALGEFAVPVVLVAPARQRRAPRPYPPSARMEPQPSSARIGIPTPSSS